MQTVTAAFTAAEKSTFRQVAQNLQTSWHKQSTLGNITFTIGVSVIGGSDVIGINPGALGSPANYKYFDDSSNVISMAWERGYNIPQGGLTVGLGEAILDNNSGRYLPRFMGGNSELSTAILPARPIIMSAGLNVSGVDNLVQHFSGLISEIPMVNVKQRTVALNMQDYVYFFQNRYLENAVVFTGQRTDQVIETLFSQLGMSTSQYDLDIGLNFIPVGAFEIGTQFSSAIGKLVEAENGQFYQDEFGVFRFENRQHWDVAPYTQVQKVISTSMVIDVQSPDQSHIVNVVEVSGSPYTKQQNQLIWQITGYAGADIPEVLSNSTFELWASFSNPILAMDIPALNGTINQTSYFVANDKIDGSGNDVTSNVEIKYFQAFAQSCKITFQNNGSATAFITILDIWGRPATKEGNIYYRSAVGESITAYQEQDLQINNDFIQTQDWAETMGEMILKDFSNPDNLQVITIRAIPELQIGDLVSWQGRYSRIYDIKTTIDPGIGFLQQLTLIQKTIYSYFRIGVSTIGGGDLISP